MVREFCFQILLYLVLLFTNFIQRTLSVVFTHMKTFFLWPGMYSIFMTLPFRGFLEKGWVVLFLFPRMLLDIKYISKLLCFYIFIYNIFSLGISWAESNKICIY